MIVFSFLFGLAIFVYAMHTLESGIRLLSGERLKLWITNGTANPVTSAASGVIVTAIMQSSSMVSLLVLAFVSAGIMPLYNGIGVVLGANLGTTMTGWVVTIIGFKLKLQALVVPLLGVGAALNLTYLAGPRTRGLGQALLALGLLIFGLDIMKDSVAGLSDAFDITSLKDMPSWVYLITGVVLAAVMQSSSAVMIIALSMLHSDVVGLTDAAAVVIGADLGTTSTTVLGSLGQSMIKKQLAFAHVFFNVVVNTLAFFILLPSLEWLLASLRITDPMFGLVAFHSTFNFAGMLAFLPVLKYYTRWIQRILPIREDIRVEYFKVPVEVPEAAIDSLQQAFQHLATDAIRLHLQGTRLDTRQFQPPLEIVQFARYPGVAGDFEYRYEALKKFESDLMKFATDLRRPSLRPNQEQMIEQIVQASRSLVYATKTLKDIRADLEHLHDFGDDPLAQALEQSHRAFLEHCFRLLIPLFYSDHAADYVSEQTSSLSQQSNRQYESANKLVTDYVASQEAVPERSSTWLNLNHELHHYLRYLMDAINAIPRKSV